MRTGKIKKRLSKIPGLLDLKRLWYYRIKHRPETDEKIFCIGFNKTGTTSLTESLREIGYQIGWQRKAEGMLRDYLEYDFQRLLKYCNTATVFQDVPFSLPGLYKILDEKFPNAKFILTVRDTPSACYESVKRFHMKCLDIKTLPTADQLKQHNYIYKGFFGILCQRFMVWKSLTPTTRGL